MLKSLLAVAAMSLPAAALVAQAPESQPRVQPAQWTLAGGTQGCAVHASSPQGTVVSILAGAGQEDLLFLVQNPRWSLQDGRKYDIAVAFDGSQPWDLQAVAKTEIDSDGPGLMFVVPQGDRQGLDFIAQFVGASGMQIRSEGAALTSLPLGTGRNAMTALAGCLGKMMGGTETSPAGHTFQGGGPAIKI
jgi:hypothetical protein